MSKIIAISTKLVISAAVTMALYGCTSSSNDQASQNKEPIKEVTTVNTKPPIKPSEVATIEVQGSRINKAQAQRHLLAKSKAKTAGQQFYAYDAIASTSMPYPPIYPHQRNNEKYANQQVNPVYITANDPISTFSVDVDTASYSNVRRMLNQGVWPTEGAVRVEEMINYFNYNYAPPSSAEHPFAIHTEVAVSPWNPSTHLMRVALKGYQIAKDNLPPMNLVFLFDVSGSMNNPDKLPLLKQSFSLLTRQLRQQDHVSMVVYAGASGIVLEPTTGDKQRDILAALDKLSAGGSTNGGAGIELAYKTAQKHFNKDGINRVILATDGDFNVGTTNIEQLKSLITRQKDSGVFLSILGFGQGNYNDHLMEELSNTGNGNAYYIDSFKEARKVLSDGLTGTLQVIAKDVKIQIEFNPAYVNEYRLIGYDNRQLKREDFNNDKVDAGDIGAGHTVTAFYEFVLSNSNYHFNDPLRYQGNNNKATGEQNNEMAYVKLRYKKPRSNTSQLISLPIMADTLKNDFTQASSEFQFATAVAAFGEKLRDSRYIDWPIEQIKQTAMANIGQDAWGYRHEFVQLTQNAQVIVKK